MPEPPRTFVKAQPLRPLILKALTTIKDLELSLEGYQDAHERAPAIVKLVISHLATGDADHQSHTGVRAQYPCLPGESDRPQGFHECV